MWLLLFRLRSRLFRKSIFFSSFVCSMCNAIMCRVQRCVYTTFLFIYLCKFTCTTETHGLLGYKSTTSENSSFCSGESRLETRDIGRSRTTEHTNNLEVYHSKHEGDKLFLEQNDATGLSKGRQCRHVGAIFDAQRWAGETFLA